ncbi:hypothetical protein FRC18_010493 [Serendipita sp. 400]|nr:hypothetical protein FRC18_010493 [Serendipita sp. 400]
MAFTLISPFQLAGGVIVDIGWSIFQLPPPFFVEPRFFRMISGPATPTPTSIRRPLLMLTFKRLSVTNWQLSAEVSQDSLAHDSLRLASTVASF